MRKLFLMMAVLLSIAAPSIASAQVGPPTNTVMEDTSRKGTQPTANFCINSAGTAWVPCVVNSANSPSTATACTVVANTTTVTPTGCTATGSAGNYTVGAFTPRPGYPIRLVTVGTWTGTVTLGTSVDGCVNVNPLTAGGQAYGSFTANVNEAVDLPATTGGIGYCLTTQLTSGQMTAAVRQ